MAILADAERWRVQVKKEMTSKVRLQIVATLSNKLEGKAGWLARSWRDSLRMNGIANGGRKGVVVDRAGVVLNGQRQEPEHTVGKGRITFNNEMRVLLRRNQQ